MHTNCQPFDVCPKARRPRGRRLLACASLVCSLLSGCAAITNPVADGVPVRKLPPELLGPSRQNEEPVPLSLLRQRPPAAYRVGPGDILGVWIAGILPAGEPTQVPPVRYSDGGTPAAPAIGVPVPVREDGTLLLPQIEPLSVYGMTLQQIEDAIREAYVVKRKILKPDAARISVTLQRPRQYRVTVIREDSPDATGIAFTTGFTPVLTGGQIGSPGTLIANPRRGTGNVLNLPAGENDVLNALARTGGLPGTDAAPEVYVERGGMARLEAAPAGARQVQPDLQIVRIPLRLKHGEPFTVRPEDVVLGDGDIVYVRAREVEVFYTAGLLPPGEYILPREYDLDVVDAIARVRGPMVNGAINQNNLSGSILTPGIGFPSPSLVSVIRKTKGGGQVIVKVDLNTALRDPRERLLIQPGDVIILQETMGEALVRYFDNQFRLDFVGTILRRRDAIATTTVVAP